MCRYPVGEGANRVTIWTLPIWRFGIDDVSIINHEGREAHEGELLESSIIDAEMEQSE